MSPCLEYSGGSIASVRTRRGESVRHLARLQARGMRRRGRATGTVLYGRHAAVARHLGQAEKQVVAQQGVLPHPMATSVVVGGVPVMHPRRGSINSRLAAGCRN